VEPDDPDDPLPIRALGMNGVVVKTEHVTDFIEEFWLLTSCRVRHIWSPSWRLEIVDNRHGQNCLKTPPISHYQGKMASESMVRRTDVKLVVER